MDLSERLLAHHFGSRPSGWDVRRLGDFFYERTELSSDLEKFPLHSFTIEESVTKKTERYERSFLLKDAGSNQFKVVHPGDFVINPMNLRFGAVGVSATSQPVTVSAYYDVLYLKGVEIDQDYLIEVLRAPQMLNIYDRVAIGSLLEKKRVHLSMFEELKIYVPPKGELQFISSVARCLRESIARLEKLIGTKLELKRGLLQQLVTGEKRFKEFTGERWRTVRIGDLLQEIDRYVEFNNGLSYKLASIRRRSEGLFFRGELRGNEIKTKVMKTIRTGDFLLSKMQVVHGAWGLVTRMFDGMFVSDSYVVLVPRDPKELKVEFFDYLSQTRYLQHLAYLACHGVHIEKMTFNLDDFFHETISLPPIDEQAKIVGVLSACDCEIELLQKHLYALKEQKRGLLQKLLTGQLRLNVSRKS